MSQNGSLIVVKAPDREGLMNIDELLVLMLYVSTIVPSVKTELPALYRYYYLPSIRSSFPTA